MTGKKEIVVESCGQGIPIKVEAIGPTGVYWVPVPCAVFGIFSKLKYCSVISGSLTQDHAKTHGSCSRAYISQKNYT